jgi:hypothetical protein
LKAVLKKVKKGFGIIEMMDTLKELHVNSLVSFNRREKSPFAI